MISDFDGKERAEKINVKCVFSLTSRPTRVRFDVPLSARVRPRGSFAEIMQFVTSLLRTMENDTDVKRHGPFRPCKAHH